MPTGIYKRLPRGPQIERACQQCGKIDVLAPSRACRPYCGRQCAHEALKTIRLDACPICKRQFKRRRASTKVCSGVCRIKLATRSNAKWRDPARIREYMRVYGRKHRESRKDELRMKVIARRARIRGNGGTFSLPEWRTLCEAFEGRCVCCLEKPELLTVDHVIPVSKVGRNDIGNIQPLCWPCNHKKRAQAVDYRPLFAIRCAKGYETSEWNLKRQQVLDAFGITIHLI